MAITKKQKGEMLEGLKASIAKSEIVMFVNFHGLNVKLSSELRRALRKIGTSYTVAKKTLMKKALESMGFAGEMPNLEGEVAMAYSSTELLSSAKEIHQFSKKNKTLKILGGIFENKYVGADKIITLASIPSRETLLGQIVNIINSPKKGLVVALSEIAKKKQG